MEGSVQFVRYPLNTFLNFSLLPLLLSSFPSHHTTQTTSSTTTSTTCNGPFLVCPSALPKFVALAAHSCSNLFLFLLFFSFLFLEFLCSYKNASTLNSRNQIHSFFFLFQKIEKFYFLFPFFVFTGFGFGALRKMEEVNFSRRAEWWQSMMYPVRRVWAGVAIRFGIRKTGLLKLRHDVRACEYEDVRVMWEMLNRNESDIAHSPGKTNKRSYWKLFRWARSAPYINCRS